ncbi:ERF family protein [Celeribacter naphthalenivorans]|uniref:ERF family protein n=1 Tax=Celeribacter naphthalenivorans TaxID=1614694 RepID=UPI001CF97267|nr:ERF family protein [Celeribacter naphthalenivorans]
MTELAKIEQTDAVQHLPADPMVSMIERVVLNPDADLDKLERMLVMKERMDSQNARVAFSAALSAARAEIPPIIKDATVDFTSQKGRTHYKHETLAGIAKQIDPILSAHGLSYRFRTDQGNGGVRVTCIIEHAQGHSEETSLSGSPDTSGSKNGFQAVGSAVTYLQRYTLKAALGLSAEVDDDAQGAAPRPDQRPAFNARAAAGRIMGKLRGTQSLSDLQDAWGSEASVIKEIKAADDQAYSELCQEKDARKATFEAMAKPAASTLIDGDQIPY